MFEHGELERFLFVLHAAGSRPRDGPHAKNEGAGIHFQWIRGEPNYQQLSSCCQTVHETGHCLTTWSCGQNGIGSAERSQLSSCVFRFTVDVFVRPELLRELLRLPTETNGHGPESHPSRVLNPEVTESADALDRDEPTGTQAGIAQRIERRHTCTQERRSLDGFKTVGNRYRSTRVNHHHFCVPAVDHDAGKNSVGAVDHVSSEAWEAGLVPSTTDPNTDPLTYRTGRNIRADGVDAPDDFVPRYAGINEVRHGSVSHQAGGRANTTSLNPNANLIRTGILQRPANFSEDSRFADFDGSVRTVHQFPPCYGNICSL